MSRLRRTSESELGAGPSLGGNRERGRRRRRLTICWGLRAHGLPWVRCQRRLALALEVLILQAGCGGGQEVESETRQTAAQKGVAGGCVYISVVRKRARNQGYIVTGYWK